MEMLTSSVQSGGRNSWNNTKTSPRYACAEYSGVQTHEGSDVINDVYANEHLPANSMDGNANLMLNSSGYFNARALNSYRTSMQSRSFSKNI